MGTTWKPSLPLWSSSLAHFISCGQFDGTDGGVELPRQNEGVSSLSSFPSVKAPVCWKALFREVWAVFD